jgi:hypothetical protein
MESFGYPTVYTQVKNLKIWTTTFLDSKFILSIINFHPMVRWGGFDKINVHKVYNL